MDQLKTLILFLLCTYNQAQVDEANYRLPRHVLPNRYEIELTLEEDFYSKKEFFGTASILVTVQEETTSITLNSANITYSTITAIPDDNPENIITNIQWENQEDYERIVLTVPSTLSAGNYTLKFETYTGLLHEDMYGFYLSSYTNASGEPEYIATTQFQPTYARRAFPCFDEPNFKAVFSLSINRPEDYISLGNTIITTTGTKDTFGDTPPMSTYLLAFIVSKFQGYDYHHEGAGERQIYDVWCREEALDTAKYAFDIGPDLLKELSSYTGIDYYTVDGIEKMDQVAIPDFSAGAMENWGLVTYRETALLWDENESTNSNKQRVATVIAHEFAHMWWGNLVTLEWWRWTWLNEGFARYYQYYITSLRETKWELMDQFVIEQQQVIFASDALESSAALNKEALTKTEISNKFASISYSKGASIIRMAINFLGEENFSNGIKQYLYNHSYSNTQPSDLYAALGEFAPDTLPESLSAIMESWTEEAGYPVVTVSRTNESLLALKQERFLLNSSATSDTKYYIPITYTTQEKPNFASTAVTHWLLPTDDLDIELEEESTGWVIVNLLETGYYRVNYDDELWDALQEALLSNSFGGIPVINRAQIIDDILNLARAGRIGYSRALNVTFFLENEVSYYPWYAAFNAFAFLRRRIGTLDIGEMLHTHILTMMANLYDDVNFDIPAAAEQVQILKTALTLQWACELEHESCIADATERFQKFLEDEEPINPNIRSTVYCSAVRQEESRDYWDFLWERYKTTKLATEQALILTALGCSRNEDVLKEYLRFSIESDSGIRKQDANSVFSAVLAGNPGNVDIALTFLRENEDAVINSYEAMNALGNVINAIADRLTTQEQIDEFAAFITSNENILKDTGTTAIETARANLQWVESNTEELGVWLDAFYGSAASITLSITVLLVGLTVTLLNN